MAAANPLGVYEYLPPGPSRRAANVAPDDANDLPFTTRYLWVGVGGDVNVIMANGETVKFVGVPSGYRLEISASRLLAGGTTAANITAME